MVAEDDLAFGDFDFAMMMSLVFDIFKIVALIACFYYKIYFCIDSLSYLTSQYPVLFEPMR